MSREDTALPMVTITDPEDRPYLSIIYDKTTTRIQLHSYDETFSRPVYLVIDNQAVPALLNALKKVKLK